MGSPEMTMKSFRGERGLWGDLVTAMAATGK
jgi:hypothetical protein